MKKSISLLLTVLILISSITVLTVLPSTSGLAAASGPKNLITNGDASGVNVGGTLKLKYDDSDRGVGYPENDLLGFTYYYDNGTYLYNPYGWRNNDKRYTYIELDSANSWPLSDTARFTNFSADRSFRLKGWTQAMQNVELEANKIYKVSAKVTQRPTTANPAGDWQFDMFLDPNTTTTNSATRPNGKDWGLTRGHTVLADVIAKFNNKSNTLVYGGSTYYYFGDFTEYSFTFNSNDFITENSLSPNQNGKYDARFVMLNYSAAWLMFDDVSITEVIEVKSTAGGMFTGDVKTDGTASTLTATAYYGNRFLGWYSTAGTLISDNPVYSGIVDQSMIATFEQNNIIDNGDFEAPNAAETEAAYNTYPTYNNSVFGTASVIDTCIEGSELIYGDKCLQLTPSSVTTGNAANAKLKGLINIPVTLEANTNYIWKFSYAFPDVIYASDKHYLKFSIDNPQSSGKPAWSSTVDYSFHAQRPTVDGIDEWEYSWGKNTTNAGTLENQGASVGNDWVDMYIIFTTQDAGTYFLTLGSAQSLTDSVVIDNMSLTKAVKDTTATTVTVSGNGTVSSYRTDEEAFRATQARGSATVFSTLESTPYFNQMYVTFTAKADRGNIFTGWYENDTLISTDSTLTTWSTGKAYTAKFIVDETKYVVTAKAEGNGGYITDDTDENEFFRDDTVTFTAHTYKGNTFKGWYDGTTLLCTDAVYKHTVNKNVNLVARFEINNLFSDSGFENTEPATSLWGEGNEWYVDGDATATYGDVVSSSAADGSNSLAIRAPQLAVVHKPLTVEAGKQYHLSISWRTANAFADDNVSGLAYIKVLDAATGVTLAWDTAFKASLGADWQQSYLNFQTGSATSVKVVISYNAKASAMFLDDIALFPTDAQNFTVSASVKEENGTFPGYIVSQKEQSVAFGDTVTLTAKAYEKNVFKGWYDGQIKASSDLSYTFTAESYRNLTAVFESKNLSADSGFENLAVGSDLSKGNDAAFVNSLSNGAFVVTDSDAFDGAGSLKISHKNREFTYKINGLEENSYYVFSFMWKLSQTQSDSRIDYIKAVGARTDIALTEAKNLSATNGWQKAEIYFNTYQDTDVLIKMLYTATADLLIDDLTIYKANNVYVVAASGGTVTSTHSGATDAGTSVTATATADSGNTFKGWYDYNSPKTLLSTDTTYTFTVKDGGVNEIIAYFEGDTAEEINYFTDGDFEDGAGLDIVFSHPTWTNIQDDYYEYVSATTSGVLPVSGDKMLSIQANGHYTNIMVPNLKANTDYTLSFWMYLENNSAFNMIAVMPYYVERGTRLEQSNQGATYIKYSAFDASQATSMAESHTYLLGNEAPNGKWRKIELQFNSGNTPTEYLHISASILGIPYYIDDLRLTEGTSGYSESLVNGDFEDDAAINGWLSDYDSLSESGNSFAGTNAALKQNLILEDTAGYTLTFRARSQSNERLMFGFTAGGTEALTTQNALTNVSYDTATLTSEWQYYTLNFSTVNHKFNSLYFIPLNNGYFEIDDVKLTRATDLVPVEQFTFEDSEQKFPFVHVRGLAATVSNNADWYEYSTDEHHSGSYSLKMKHKNSFTSHPLIQDWTVLSLYSGKTYKMSFFVKGAEGDAFRFRVMTNDKNWQVEALIDSTETLKNDGWNQFTYYFTVDNIELTTGKQVEFSIDGVEGKSTADMYFDDFYIEESERYVTTHSAEMLYTQDLSQNYFENYSFEKNDGVFDNYIKSGDAFFGKRFITLNQGDKLIVPVTTRRDVTYPFHSQYTFAASVLSDASSVGRVTLAADAKGEKIIKDKSGKEANLLINTDNKWKRVGFSFENSDIVTLYLVIECDEGSFSLDYLSLFNRLREYEENTHDLNDYPVFDTSNPDNFVDADSFKEENLLLGTIYELPEGSKVILEGKKTYSATVSASGEYEIRDIQNGTYNLFILASDAQYATMWGDITFEDGKATGLGLTRLSGTVLVINGQGVKNGVARIDDTETGYGYLTATDGEGYFTAYILDSAWELIGTTDESTMLEKYALSFANNANVVRVAVDTDIPTEQSVSYAAVIVVTLTFALAAALLFITRKKGENA